jgi:20S proteasome alpha/beta subunit
MHAKYYDSGVRPYGVSLLVAGWDINRGPSLYQVDPSGSFWAWKASAIGKNMVNAKTFLEKRYVLLVNLRASSCSDIHIQI